MNVHFDVGHPAHVHLFKNAIDELQARGHETLVTSRRKEVTTDLLDAYGIDHRPISEQGDSSLALATELVVRAARLVRTIRSFGSDVVVSHINPSAAQAAWLTGAKSVVFNDDEAAAKVGGRITHPFATAVCTPSTYRLDLGEKHRLYDGFHELAYLHPDRFTPDPAVLQRAGIDPDDPYYVLRLVSFRAHHDVGHSGFSPRGAGRLVDRLSEHGAVYVTSEDGLPPAYEEYQLPVAPKSIHHLLAFADLYVGDSQTMATEAAVLGTPAIRSNSFAADEDISIFRTLDAEYGLVRSIGDEEAAIERAVEMATDPTAGERWERRRQNLLDDTEDVTDFMIDVIETEGRR